MENTEAVDYRVELYFTNLGGRRIPSLELQARTEDRGRKSGLGGVPRARGTPFGDADCKVSVQKLPDGTQNSYYGTPFSPG